MLEIWRMPQLPSVVGVPPGVVVWIELLRLNVHAVYCDSGLTGK